VKGEALFAACTLDVAVIGDDGGGKVAELLLKWLWLLLLLLLVLLILWI
jgi:hypothetical protein